jgi:hypothetical protein
LRGPGMRNRELRAFSARRRGQGREAARSKWGGEIEPVGVAFGVGGDFVEDGAGGGLRLPGPEASGLGVVEDDPGKIERARGGVGGDGMRTEALIAPGGELA